MNLLAKLPGYSLFNWWDAVMYYEIKELGKEEKELPALDKVSDAAEVKRTDAKLKELCRQIQKTAIHMDSQGLKILRAYDITIEGVCIWNEIGSALTGKETEAFPLAERLETWFMHYKALWRENSKEGDLAHVAEIVFWYADLLRGRTRRKRRRIEC